MDPTLQNQPPANGAPASGGGMSAPTSVGGNNTTNQIYISPGDRRQPRINTPETTTTTTMTASAGSSSRNGTVMSDPNAALAYDVPQPQRPAQPGATTRVITKPGINWGGVIKGAAIIGAVVLVGVVAYSLIAPAAFGMMSHGVVGMATANVVSGVQTAFQGLVAVGQIAMHAVTTIAIHVGSWFGISAAMPAATVGTATAGSTAVGLAGAAAATGIGATVAIPMLKQIQLMDPHAHHMIVQTPQPDAVLAAPAPQPHDIGSAGNMNVGDGSAQVAATATTTKKMLASQVNMNNPDPLDAVDDAVHANKMSLHAGEHNHEHNHNSRGIRAALARSTQASQSFADRVQAGRTDGTPLVPKRNDAPIAPRDASFSTQLDAETAKLAALSEGGRA